MTGKTVGGPKILLVDDDKIVIEALTDLFKRILPAAWSGVLRHPVFPINTVGFACALNTLDGSLCNLVLFAEFRNLAGQRHALVSQFRRGILTAHLLDDFRPLRGKGIYLPG